MRAPWHNRAVQDALAQVAAAGFDLAHDFDTRAIADLPPGHGVLIGNSRALWPLFEAARRDEDDPLEHYTERVIDAAFVGARIFYAHRKYDGSFIPFQKIAVATGFGALAPSRLVVHPRFGPWFALRAIVIVDGTGPSRSPIAQPCTCEANCALALDAALADPFEWRAWLAVRDACSLRAERYTDEQIHYHYTHAFPGKREDVPHVGEHTPGKPR
jgi:hypothetical protein